MRVFVSATKEDLDPDCRPAVRRAVAIGDAQAETMEDWNAEYGVNPVNLCRTELEVNSTHFIGVFAHRLGWTPPGFEISITEAEFEWACHARPRKPMVVFMPKPGTPFDTVLEQRAANQTEAAKKAQAEFRRRVRESGGTIAVFEDPVELGIRVSNHVTLWSNRGLRAIAREARATGAPPPVHLLGRSRHQAAFNAAWEMLAGKDLPSIAGFLLHGPQDAGQSELIERFVDGLDNKAGDLRKIIIRIGASWVRKDLATLLQIVGHELQPGWVPPSPGEVAARLAGVLDNSHVVLEIHNLHRFWRGAAGVIEEFWHPLCAAFKSAPRHQCIVFFVMDGDPDAACQPLLFDPVNDGPDTFASRLVFRLPPLGKFTIGELKVWLRKLPFVVADPDATAQALFDETNGDPARLLSKLKSEPLT